MGTSLRYLVTPSLTLCSIPKWFFFKLFFMPETKRIPARRCHIGTAGTALPSWAWLCTQSRERWFETARCRSAASGWQRSLFWRGTPHHKSPYSSRPRRRAKTILLIFQTELVQAIYCTQFTIQNVINQYPSSIYNGTSFNNFPLKIVLEQRFYG